MELEISEKPWSFSFMSWQFFRRALHIHCATSFLMINLIYCPKLLRGFTCSKCEGNIGEATELEEK